MKTVYGYTRVSTEHQADSGLSLDAQLARINERIARLCAESSDLKAGRVYRDAAVSATKINFRRRPQGGILYDKVQTGDHIVIAKLDRGFRSNTDCLLTVGALIKRGVTVHILDIAVDTSSPSGQLMLGIMATIAQWETQRLGERIRDALRQRRERTPGIAVSASRVFGWAIDARHMLTPHAEERATGKLAHELRTGGMNYTHIAAELNRRGLIRAANPYGPMNQRIDRPWTRGSVTTLIKYHRAGWPRYPKEEFSK